MKKKELTVKGLTDERYNELLDAEVKENSNYHQKHTSIYSFVDFNNEHGVSVYTNDEAVHKLTKMLEGLNKKLVLYSKMLKDSSDMYHELKESINNEKKPWYKRIFK